MVVPRFVRWLLAGLVLAACGASSSDEHTKAQSSSGTSGQGTSGQGAAGSRGATGGTAGKAGDSSGVGGTGATSRGGSGDVAGDGGNGDPSSTGGMSASGKGGSLSIVGGSGNAGGTQGRAGAGSGNMNEGGDGAGSPIDACLGEVSHFTFPPTCTTALVPLDDDVGPCEFAMPRPSGVPLIYGEFGVTYTSDLGSAFVPQVSGPSGCDEAPGSGFYYGDKAEPYSIVLCPCTCAAAAEGNGELDALYGCVTIER